MAKYKTSLNEKDLDLILAEEHYFRTSYSFAYLRWKLDNILVAKTFGRILKKIKPESTLKILDVGCDRGQIVFRLNDLYQERYPLHFTGVDINPRAIDFAQKRALFRKEIRNETNFHFIHQDVSKGLNFPDETFDIIISTEVIEHFEQPDEVLKDMHRGLKNKGVALFTTPIAQNIPKKMYFLLNSLSGGILKKAYFQGVNELWTPPHEPEFGFAHISEKLISEWGNIFKTTGFRVIDKVRGPLVFGGPFFDRHPFLFGLILLTDAFLDRLPFTFKMAFNIAFVLEKV